VIAPEYEKRAKQMRAERDRQYGNIYAEAATDERWVGDLGEMVFNSWFKHEGIQGFEWVLDDAAGQPDFVTALNPDFPLGAVSPNRRNLSSSPKSRFWYCPAPEEGQTTASHAVSSLSENPMNQVSAQCGYPTLFCAHGFDCQGGFHELLWSASENRCLATAPPVHALSPWRNIGYIPPVRA
jgi:hypothetical protein